MISSMSLRLHLASHRPPLRTRLLGKPTHLSAHTQRLLSARVAAEACSAHYLAPDAGRLTSRMISSSRHTGGYNKISWLTLEVLVQGQVQIAHRQRRRSACSPLACALTQCPQGLLFLGPGGCWQSLASHLSAPPPRAAVLCLDRSRHINIMCHITSCALISMRR
jgi:hypothetical protein